MTTTYDVVATRSGDWWAIEVVSGLPDNMLGVSQTRRLGEVPNRARSVVADLLEVDADDIEVKIEVDLPRDLQRAIDLYAEADVVERAARSAAAKARSQAAATLVRADLTMREAGELLGVSHQRVKQLVDRALEAEAAALEGDEDDRAEMLAVVKLMESLRSSR